MSPAITSAQYMHPAAAAYGLAAGPQFAAAAREQEMMYRELLSRMQCNSDPVLAQHVSKYGVFLTFKLFSMFAKRYYLLLVYHSSISNTGV